MPEENAGEIKQVCRMEIVFPIESDEQAIAIKRIVGEALKDIKNKRFTFSIAEN